MSRRVTVLIAGGGLAAGKAVEGLRRDGFDGRIVLAGAERHLPYERPPMSKGYLMGTDDLASALVHPPEWYDEHDVDLELGTSVTAIDVVGHIATVGGARIGYDKALIATGSSPRRLPAADDSGAPVAYLRTIDDSDRIRAVLGSGRRIVIIGGGWIGLEVAAAARRAGADVVVVEALPVPLMRVLGPEVGDVVADLHRSHGVDLRTRVSVSAVGARAGRAVVELDDGRSVDGDLLVVGVGATPNTALAEHAGLKTDNGVVVDELLRTSHPDVFAAGDVANSYHPRLRRYLRVEHWDNAIGQGFAAARNMLGHHQAYERLPYFYSDQYDAGMEFVGSIGPAGYDRVVLRGDVPGRVFTAFWIGGGRVLAGMHVNDWDAIEPIRRIVAGGSADLRALGDPDVPLGDVTP
jgi:3-phenylpropionate/trans-cinnamate dioxygenase ferredoxin reductase subunit